MTRESIIANIRSLEVKMRPLVVEAGIKYTHLQMPGCLDKYNLVEIIEALEWMKRLHTNQWALCKETKDLLPDKIWETYKYLDMDNAAEMKELHSRYRELRRAIINKSRPRIFRVK